MRITKTFFNAAVPTRCDIVYMMPTQGVTRLGYAFAEFAAARSAVAKAFTQANWDGYGALPIGDDVHVKVTNHVQGGSFA